MKASQWIVYVLLLSLFLKSSSMSYEIYTTSVVKTRQMRATGSVSILVSHPVDGVDHAVWTQVFVGPTHDQNLILTYSLCGSRGLLLDPVLGWVRIRETRWVGCFENVVKRLLWAQGKGFGSSLSDHNPPELWIVTWQLETCFSGWVKMAGRSFQAWCCSK